ncbi:hypothetical protein AUJ14_05060 [Candidatus Micrarchaeota archaeon CG1_02_55_22]|nr:MAG: hypothetical protein AUJ14_05060 [Candidatus Micrarchaeota archaeon CG1_02_55_22]
MAVRDSSWFSSALYSDFPRHYQTFSSLNAFARNRLLRALQVPRVPDERVSALEVGPGFSPMLTQKNFGRSTFLDFSGWFTKHLKTGLDRVAPERAREYLMAVRNVGWTNQPHLNRLYGPKQLAQVRADAQARLDAMADSEGLEPERFSFVKGDLRRLPFGPHAFHLALLPEVLTHIEPEKRADAVARLADAVTHRLVIVDRPPQPGLLLEPEPVRIIRPEAPTVKPVMSEQAVDPEELRRVLISKGFRVRVERHDFSHLPEFKDTEGYFLLTADRRMPARVRRGVAGRKVRRSGRVR